MTHIAEGGARWGGPAAMVGKVWSLLYLAFFWSVAALGVVAYLAFPLAGRAPWPTWVGWADLLVWSGVSVLVTVVARNRWRSQTEEAGEPESAEPGAP
jgi:cytochrome b561